MNIQSQVSLASYNTLGIAATAAWFAEAESLADIQQALAFAKREQLPLLLLGGGSNLVLTGDYPGLVLKIGLLGRDVAVAADGQLLVTAAAGENWHELVCWSLQQGYCGLENLSLIPGCVGAAPIQNIGAYGVELKDVMHSLTALELTSGEPVTLSAADCEFGYRDSIFKGRDKGRYLITSVTFALSRTPELHIEYGAIRDQLTATGMTEPTPQAVSDAVCAIRRSKLPDPATLGNAGSFFKNPVVSTECFEGLKARFPGLVNYPQPDGQVKLAAGWLIDQLGWKGHRQGPVGVHDKQALVLANYAGGSGQDIMQLAQSIQDSVQAHYGLELEIEPQVI